MFDMLNVVVSLDVKSVQVSAQKFFLFVLPFDLCRPLKSLNNFAHLVKLARPLKKKYSASCNHEVHSCTFRSPAFERVKFASTNNGGMVLKLRCYSVVDGVIFLYALSVLKYIILLFNS